MPDPIIFIDDTGVHRKRLDQILADKTSAYQGIYGTDKDVGPSTIDGQWLGSEAEALAAVAETIEAVRNGCAPDGAVGTQLSRLARIIGITRKPAEFSTVTLTLSGTPSTVVTAGKLVVNDEDETAVFQTTADATIGGGGTVTVAARSSSSGPIPGPAGHLTVIQTVVAGWTSVTNVSAAALGSLEETDPQLRQRYAASVALPSVGIIDGLFAALDQLADVAHVRVYENEQDVAVAQHGGGTLAPHAIQVVIDGGDAAQIASTIWLKKSPGVTQVGAQAVDIIDSQGLTKTMRFDRPTDVPIFVKVILTAAVTSPTADAIIAAIVAFGNGLLPNFEAFGSDIGGDVIWSRLFIPINTAAPGVSVLSLLIGTVNPPVASTNVTIPFASIARWDPANVVVTW
jgi:uncharacterized phage protein gp47/JayE